MKKGLVIRSSTHGESSYTNQLIAVVTERIAVQNKDIQWRTRDLGKEPVPHLNVNGQEETQRISEQAVSELMDSEMLVIGVPMHNFSIPSVLKAWIDHIVVAGQTFKFTPEGPIGLARNKKVFLAISTGNVYSEGPFKAFDFTEIYMRSVLGFIGVHDITAYRVEGVAIPGVREGALERAISAIRSSPIE